MRAVRCTGLHFDGQEEGTFALSCFPDPIPIFSKLHRFCPYCQKCLPTWSLVILPNSSFSLQLHYQLESMWRGSSSCPELGDCVPLIRFQRSEMFLIVTFVVWFFAQVRYTLTSHISRSGLFCICIVTPPSFQYYLLCAYQVPSPFSVSVYFGKRFLFV